MNIKKTFKDIVITSLIVTTGTALGYALRILFARNLSQSDYGLFYAIIAFFVLFSMFRSLGTTESLVHFIPKYLAEKNWNKLKFSTRSVLLLQIIVSSVISFLFFIFSDFIALHFFHMNEASLLIKFQAITFFIIGAIDVFVSIFRGFQRPILASLYDPIRLMIVGLFSIFLIKMNIFTVKTLFIVWLISYVLLALFYILTLFKNYRKLFDIKSVVDSDVIKDIKSYSIPLMFGMGAQLMFSRIDELILLFFKGSSEVALFEIAYPASQLMLVLVAPFTFVLFPMISKLFFENKKDKIREALQIVYNTGLFFIAPFAVLLLLYPDLIIRVLFSSKYIEASLALQIMTIGTLFLIFSTINMTVLSGIGKMITRTKILYSVGAFNIFLNLTLAPKFGVIGTVTATSISFSILWITSYMEFIKEIPGFTVKVKYLIRILISLIVFLLSMIVLKNIFTFSMYVEAILFTLISFSVYLSIGVFVLKIINLESVKKIYTEIMK